MSILLCVNENVNSLLDRKAMDVNEHEIISNFTLGYKSKWKNSAFNAVLDFSHNRVCITMV